MSYPIRYQFPTDSHGFMQSGRVSSKMPSLSNAAYPTSQKIGKAAVLIQEDAVGFAEPPILANRAFSVYLVLGLLHMYTCTHDRNRDSNSQSTRVHHWDSDKPASLNPGIARHDCLEAK